MLNGTHTGCSNKNEGGSINFDVGLSAEIIFVYNAHKIVTNGTLCHVLFFIAKFNSTNNVVNGVYLICILNILYNRIPSF